MCINNISNWIYENGIDDNIVLYSKVSIYRNIDNIRFYHYMDKDEFNEVDNILKPVIEELNTDLSCIKFSDLSPINIRILMENLTIPNNKYLFNASLYTNTEESTSILINSNEHLEIQSISRGLELEKCLEKAYKIENEIDKKVDFAYNKKFGYLTSSPYIIGIAMNITVCMAIPCLIWKNPDNVDYLISEYRKIGLNIEIKRGLLYITNNTMLGFTNKCMLDNFMSKVNEILNKEKNIRDRIKKLDKIKVEDKIYRSKSILLSAKSLKYKELINYTSWIRVGLYYGILENINLNLLYYMIFLGKKSHLKLLYKGNTHYKDIDEIRANIIRELINK